MKSLPSSHRYFFLKHHETFKLFLSTLHRLIPALVSIKSTPIMPDAPPLPSDMIPTAMSAEDTFGISTLFDESTPTTVLSNPPPVVYHSISISHRKRTILTRCLEIDLCSDDSSDHDDYIDLLNYLEKNYFHENLSIILDDVRATINTSKQIINLANLIQQSSTIPRFLHHLLQYEILTPDNENLLLEHLGISFE